MTKSGTSREEAELRREARENLVTAVGGGALDEWKSTEAAINDMVDFASKKLAERTQEIIGTIRDAATSSTGIVTEKRLQRLADELEATYGK
jgi:hypothetical protein